jgi:hypothetical protein
LKKLLQSKWKIESIYEHSEYPIHTYSNTVYDPLKERWMILIEAVDPTISKELGLNLEVDRILLYENTSM